MRSKRSKKWHLNSDARKARAIIEQGLKPEPSIWEQLTGGQEAGRPVPPHRSGGGYPSGAPYYGQSVVGALVDECATLPPALVRVPK